MEQVIGFLNFEVEVFGMILPDLLFFAVVGIMALSIVRSTFKAMAKGKVKSDAQIGALATVWLECADCGWEGEVPKLRKVCPKCKGSNFVM